MTIQKVFITQDKTIHLLCASCNRQWVANAAAYYDIQKEVRLQVKCKCGKSWSCILEKRKHYRKAVSLPGRYAYEQPGGSCHRGDMIVIDISLKGLRLKMDRDFRYRVGDYIDVEFRLDNKQRKRLERRVRIKNVSGRTLGVALPEITRNDPDIGFYLL